jgi:hypothetical protein
VDAARSRLNAAADEILDFLQLLEAIESLAAARASNDVTVPEVVHEAIARVVGVADPARLHRLGYLVTVVFTYAAFERFVRDLIVMIAKSMTAICGGYERLPVAVRENHLRLTLKVASLNADRSGADESSLTTMLTRLLACLEGVEPFELNDEVFADHQANFRTGVLRDALRRVGVDVAEGRTTPEIDERLAHELNGLYARTATVIDDLADRRNQAAHGDEVELLDRPTLHAVISVVRSYADALAEDSFCHLARLAVEHHGAEIGSVDHTWSHPDTGERTVCRVVPAQAVAVEQRIILLGQHPRLATVRSIQLENASVDTAGPSDLHHGIDLGIISHDGERLYAVPTDLLDIIEGLVAAPA